MRIASFNVESLFDRAKALSLPTWEDGRKILEAYAETNMLLNEPAYTPKIKGQLVELLLALGLKKEDQPKGGFAMLRQNRGHLVKRTKVGTDTKVEIVANAREDWIGWIELTKEPTDELATEHTAMVMRDVKADVLGVVEADNRIALKLFSEVLLKKVDGTPYDHVMLIDGNDDRGIDVGILTRKGFDIPSVTSHVDDAVKGQRIFSRDCPAYAIKTKKNNRLAVLVNHLKSKGYGPPKVSSALRERQAAARKHEPERHLASSRVHKGRTRRHLRPRQPQAEVRLPAPLPRPLRQGHRWRRVPQGRVGREQESTDQMADLPNYHRVRPRCIRPRCHLRGPRHLSESPAPCNNLAGATTQPRRASKRALISRGHVGSSTPSDGR